MDIEQLIKQLRAPDPEKRVKAIEIIAELAAKTSSKKKFLVLVRALRVVAKKDSKSNNRQLAKQYIKEFNNNPPKFGSSKNKLNALIPKILFAAVAFFVFVGILVHLFSDKSVEPIDPKLELVKKAKIGDLLNPLNVKAISPRELKGGIHLKYKPRVGDVKRSHVRQTIVQRSGGREIGASELWFDLKRKIIRVNSSKGEYVVEFRTSKVNTPVSILAYGYPEPGKKIRKRINAEGVVQEISGDIYGIVPAMAFVNNYHFPVMKLEIGSVWNEKKTTEDVTMSTKYILNKVLKVKGSKYLYVTFKRQVTFEKINIETSMYQYAEGEIYFDYKHHFPIFMKETSLTRLKKFDSKIGMEIKTTKTETFSDAHRVIGLK